MFVVYLPLKLFRATVASDRMLVKFEENRVVRNIQKVELFDNKMVNHF